MYIRGDMPWESVALHGVHAVGCYVCLAVLIWVTHGLRQYVAVVASQAKSHHVCTSSMYHESGGLDQSSFLFSTKNQSNNPNNFDSIQIKAI